MSSSGDFRSFAKMAANCPVLSKRTLIEAIFCLRGQKTHLGHGPPRLGVGTPDLDSTPLTVMLELMCKLQDKIMPRNYYTIKKTPEYLGLFQICFIVTYSSETRFVIVFY